MNKFLLLIIGAALFAGCSKNNNSVKKNDPASSAKITGKWYVTKDTLEVTFLDENFNIAEGPGSWIQFNADGTGTDYKPDYGDDVEHFTYTAADTKLTVKVPAQSLGGNNDEAYSSNLTIKKLTATDLVMLESQSITQDDVTTSYNGIIYCSKTNPLPAGVAPTVQRLNTMPAAFKNQHYKGFFKP